ncbi:MAG TPA: diaminopimelate epimerase [Methanoregula sp.]|nr:diaminopimelate epimerase [Methanoregula sp.]
MELPFAKLHGNGNDFIVIDEYQKVVIPDEMKGQFAACYCDRRFGIGADGVIYLMRSAKNDLRMRIFQPDESEAEMCGNGIRCLAKVAFDAGYVKESCMVETPAGPVGVAMENTEDGFFATVTMTLPKFERKDIPATGSGEYTEHIGEFEVNAVNTGVPHAVILVEALDGIDVAAVAPAIRRHASFPNGANVNFVEKSGGDSIRIRTFERGVEEETLSCGTGATAAAAVMHKLGHVGDVVEVETRGGPLTIDLRDGAKMRGPATMVFTGTIPF